MQQPETMVECDKTQIFGTFWGLFKMNRGLDKKKNTTM